MGDLADAIPPAYTEHIGEQVMAFVRPLVGSSIPPGQQPTATDGSAS